MTAIERDGGNSVLLEALRGLGIDLYAGVNGGGVVHLAKHMEPLYELPPAGGRAVRLLTINEYVAGYMPLGHYLATGRPAGCLTTTGAASKLAGSGLSEAKMLNIPAVYLVALNSTFSVGSSPLQDVSEQGMNLVPQLAAELGDGCIVIDNASSLEEKLAQARRVLASSRPVALAFHPDLLSRPAPEVGLPPFEAPPTPRDDAARFVAELAAEATGRRIVVYACDEASRCRNIRELTTRLCEALHAPVVYSVNGANAVARDNRFAYGHISVGGNDEAMKLWRGIGPDDLVITLGFDPGEFAMDLQKIAAGHVWHLGNLAAGYGHRNGEFKHRVTGQYHRVRGDVGLLLASAVPQLETLGLDVRRSAPAPRSLNSRPIARSVREGCVDLVAFYEALYQRWRPNSIGFDDACVAIKDRQYVAQRPHPNIRFYNSQDGGGMGGAYGMGIGAKLADPSLHTFVFSGDGCFRLFGAALSEAAALDLRLFILNNGTMALVDTMLDVVLPGVDRRRHHARVPQIDYVAAARAQDWVGLRLAPDLANLDEIMDACYQPGGRSVLVDVPVDDRQLVGYNPRVEKLTLKTYL